MSEEVGFGEKEFYDLDKVMECVEEYVRYFVLLVERFLREYEEKFGEKGIIVVFYDIEFFGYWWFEGVKWFGRVLEFFY